MAACEKISINADRAQSLASTMAGNLEVSTHILLARKAWVVRQLLSHMFKSVKKCSISLWGRHDR